MKVKTLQGLYLWLPPVLWATLIFRFSSGTVPVASDIFWQDFAVKKTGHLILFGTLAILIYRAFIGYGMDRKGAALRAIVLTFFYGITDEIHQNFTEGREATVRDVLIDGLGAATSVYLVYYFLPYLPKEIRILAGRFGIA